MPTMQNTRAELRQQIHDQVQSAVQEAQAARDAAAQGGKAAGGKGQTTPVLAPTAQAPLPPLRSGEGRLIIDKRGDQTVITSAALPPEVLPLAKMAQDTVAGFLAVLVVVIVGGPFARMLARRMDRSTEIKAAGHNAQVLNQQIQQLQQSVDAMSLELERISESQRFQDKLLSERSKG
jgi:outer membrane murein-binding lipoprotein Lpp